LSPRARSLLAPGAFKPAWWLPGGHLQTLWPHFTRRRPSVRLDRVRWELPDGDFLDVDRANGGGNGTVLILHGLEGSSDSAYARGLARALVERGYRVAILHFRGCSGEANRLDRSYHSGETGDLDWAVRRLQREVSGAPIAVVGYSLGGNVLLKWLGELGAASPVSAAVAVSVPFDLAVAAERLNRGLSKLYQWKLLGSLRRRTIRKFSRRHSPLNLDRVAHLRNFWEFDDYVTAPLHGFAGADDYYGRSSSRRFLASIRVPTLVLHALDDPFMTPDAVPTPAELSLQVSLELSPTGGHVGFVSGLPWRPVYWLEQRIPDFLDSQLLGSEGRSLGPTGQPFSEAAGSATISPHPVEPREALPEGQQSAPEKAARGKGAEAPARGETADAASRR
jgi:predicted alpha/beta-fold hydrolase